MHPITAAGTLPAAWARGWGAAPERPALAGPDRRRWSAGELEDRTARAARRLLATGAVPGDRVVLRGPSSLDLVVAHLGVLRAGLVSVPLNPSVPASEAARLLALARPRVAMVVAGAGDLGEALGDAAVLPLADEGGRAPDRSVGAAGAAADRPLDAARPEDPALLLFTSGTTGEPKGVVLSHANLLAGAAAVVDAWAWTPEDRLVLALPLFHLHGLGLGVHGTLLAGASATIRHGFDPDDLATTIPTERATLFFGVPTMYRRLARAGRAAVLAPLRLAVSGSAPLPSDLFEAVEAASGHRLLERYGLTETVMVASNPLVGERRSGTVGRPLPGVQVRLAPGSDEILVRGPSVFRGYLDRPDATAEAFVDGWFRTGDLGAFDPDGYLRIVGRAKELIISGGSNVHPREVEDALRAHPGVVDVAVIGVPDDDWGEAVVAVVEAPDVAAADRRALADALAARAATTLAPAKRPKRITVVDALPRNALGKITKAALVDP